MKKCLVIFAVAVSGFGFGQLPENFDQQIRELSSELELRRQLAGYTPDEKIVFQPILKKVLNNTLNVDSLVSAQPQLYRIRIYENSKGNENETAVSFFNRINFDSYKDTQEFNIEYEQSELAKGDRTETLVINRVTDNTPILFVHIQYETYSNLIYSIITN